MVTKVLTTAGMVEVLVELSPTIVRVRTGTKVVVTFERVSIVAGPSTLKNKVGGSEGRVVTNVVPATHGLPITEPNWPVIICDSSVPQNLASSLPPIVSELIVNSNSSLDCIP